MKKILFMAVLFISFTGIAQKGKINWITVEQAMEAQKKEPRKILIDMYTNWCGPCKMLDKITFQNKDVADYVNKNYYAVKFNAEGNSKVTFKGKTYINPNYDTKRSGRNSPHQFTYLFNVRAYPTVLFLDEKGTLIYPLKGALRPNQMEFFLKFISTNFYKKGITEKNFKEFAKEFKSQFKE